MALIIGVIISGLLVFAFGLYVIFLNRKTTLNQIYFVLSLLVSFFAFVYYNFYIAYNKKIATFWYQFLVLWPLIVVFTFHFILVFVKHKVKLLWVSLLYITGFIFIIYQYYIFSKHYIKVIQVNNIWLYYVVPHFSIFDFIFILWTVILEVLSLFYLIKFYIKNKSLKLKQITLIIILGILIPFIYGFLKGVIQGQLGVKIIDLNVPLYALSTIIFGYGIVKYGIFKITLKDKLIEIFNSSNILFIIIKNQKVDFINNFTKTTLKIKNKDISKLNIFDFIDISDYKKILNAIIKNKTHDNRNSFELKIYDKNKVEHFVIFNITRLFDEINEIYYYILIGNDITYQKKIEQQLIKAKELAEISDISKQNFIHVLHHELKTPLTSIIGFSEILSRKIKNEEIKNELKIINNSGKILYEYFENLIDISSLDFKTIREDIFNINSVIRDIRKTYEFLAREKKISFNIEILCNIKKIVIGDFLKTKQVINMVLNNSFKFISKNPEINLIIEEIDKSEFIKIKHKNNSLNNYNLSKDNFNYNYYLNKLNNTFFYKFIIKDNGIGIDNDKINKIDQIFELGENVMNKNFRGIGLGLFIVNKILDMLGGKFFIKSEINKGTEVYIIIPFKSITKNNR